MAKKITAMVIGAYSMENKPNKSFWISYSSTAGHISLCLHSIINIPTTENLGITIQEIILALFIKRVPLDDNYLGRQIMAPRH